MAFTDDEKAKIRKYLGYPQVDSAVLSSVDTYRYSYRINYALDHVSSEGETVVRDYLTKLDTLESSLMDAAATLSVSGVGSIQMRNNPGAKIRTEMRYWTQRIADLLDVPILPGSAIASAGINAEVRP